MPLHLVPPTHFLSLPSQILPQAPSQAASHLRTQQIPCNCGLHLPQTGQPFLLQILLPAFLCLDQRFHCCQWCHGPSALQAYQLGAFQGRRRPSQPCPPLQPQACQQLPHMPSLQSLSSLTTTLPTCLRGCPCQQTPSPLQALAHQSLQWTVSLPVPHCSLQSSHPFRLFLLVKMSPGAPGCKAWSHRKPALKLVPCRPCPRACLYQPSKNPHQQVT